MITIITAKITLLKNALNEGVIIKIPYFNWRDILNIIIAQLIYLVYVN